MAAHKPARNPGPLIFLLVIAFVLAACAGGSMVGGTINHTILGSSTDSESHTFFADTGDTLVLEYTITPDKGSVSISFFDALVGGETLFYKRIEAEASDVVRIPIEKDGLHNLFVSRSSFAGTIQVQWHLEKPGS